jgi:hypothetical protein
MQLPDPQARPPGPIVGGLARLSGTDKPTLCLCPQRDHDIAAEDGALLLAVCLYQTTIFTLVLHKTLAAPGQIRPELIALGIGLAVLVMLLDIIMVMRPAWISAGEHALKRGGLLLEVGSGKRIQMGFFLTLRISIVLISATLTSMLVGTLIFSRDIGSLSAHDYLVANAPVIANATATVDGEIGRTSAGLKSQVDHVSTLSSQIDMVRQTQIDPTAADPRIQQTLRQITQLEAARDEASKARTQADDFASDELSGARNSRSNSGVAGNGPVRAAAQEKAHHAADDERRIDSQLAASRQRLDSLHKEFVGASDSARQQADTRLPQLQDALTSEQGKGHELQDRLAQLTADRDDAIQRIVMNDPDFHARDDGLLAQLRALERITHGDPIALTLVLLIDAFAFFIEAAVVCAKTFARVPTTYACLVARNAYLSDVAIAEEALEDLCVRNARDDLANPFSAVHPKAGEPDASLTRPRSPDGNGEAPVRRKRGRPPKNPPPTDPAAT